MGQMRLRIMARSSSWSRTLPFHGGNQGFESPTGYHEKGPPKGGLFSWLICKRGFEHERGRENNCFPGGGRYWKPWVSKSEPSERVRFPYGLPKSSQLSGWLFFCIPWGMRTPVGSTAFTINRRSRHSERDGCPDSRHRRDSHIPYGLPH